MSRTTRRTNGNVVNGRTSLASSCKNWKRPLPGTDIQI
nr:unnamed protein product [Callosobruchus analis]